MDFRELLAAAAAETGWSESAQVAVLLDFLEALARMDPSMLETYQGFLDLRAAAEREDDAVHLLIGDRLPWSGHGPRRA